MSSHFNKGFWSGFWSGLRQPDAFLIDKLERLCHKFQKLTGKTNFWLFGKVSAGVIVCLVCAAMARLAGYEAKWIRVIGFPLTSNALWFCWGVILMGRISITTMTWKWREKKAFERLLHGVGNPEKVDGVNIVVRYLCLIVWPPDFSIWFGLILLAVYLEACDPLPPCQGKVHEWIKSLSVKLHPVKVDV